ncbi:MAG: hypothetical protein ACFCGT_25295 [Sandaracinaceae bacterium]
MRGLRHRRRRRVGRIEACVAFVATIAPSACGGEPPPLEPPARDGAEAPTPPEAPIAARTAPDPSWTEAEAAFHTMMDALLSPRCVNCHPSDRVPKQTDLGAPHRFGVQGGPDNHGLEALACRTCHQDANNADSGVPGAPEWSLAPASMAWEGLDRYAIARSMMSPEQNGDRTPEEVHHHLTEHALVLWAWAPGVDANGTPRRPPPVPLDEYRAAVDAWFEAGAVIPGDLPAAEGTPDDAASPPPRAGYAAPEDTASEDADRPRLGAPEEIE